MSDLLSVKGISEKTELLLRKLGINSVNDLIRYYPYRYNVIKLSDISNIKNNDKVVLDGIVESNPVVSYFKGKMSRLTFYMIINNKRVKITIFNRPFLKNNITIGKTVTVIGTYNTIKDEIIASDIKFYGIIKPVVECVYHLTSGLNNKKLSGLISNAIESKIDLVNEYVPKSILEENNLLDIKESILEIHNPKNSEKLKKAIITLKYEELFIFIFKVLLLKKKILTDTRTGLKKEINIGEVNSFIENLPFKLTEDQEKAVNDIIDDISSERRMNRLLQGDVGSGKTIVGIIAMVAMSTCKKQSVLMAPTEILAKQHYFNITKLCPNLYIELLLGSSTKKEKELIYKRIKNKEVDIVIGTHALIQDDVEFNDLGLVITDEQHRFGVNQRMVLHSKGDKPDILYMSATPIPRTYALTIYGDMDISNIRTVPSGRKPVTTKLYNYQNLTEALKLIKQELDSKHQVYVVAPLIDEVEDGESVEALERQLKLAFKSSNISMLHGKLKTNEKEIIMNDFKEAKIDILISTTVIEVGVDVPNATVMVVFDAHRFGLATLHQLRGRVGRNSLDSYCLLISDSDNKRLHVMEEITDGFLISEADFENRGQGDLFGTKQHGDMNFKIANLKKDFKILQKAKEDAQKLIEEDNYSNFSNLITGDLS